MPSAISSKLIDTPFSLFHLKRKPTLAKENTMKAISEVMSIVHAIVEVIFKFHCKRMPAISGMIRRMNGASFQVYFI